MASSSASRNYVVFLSFSGKDTRQGFISHLYDSLCAEGIETFIDEDLPKGDRIDKIFEVIKEARIYIVVFSTNYASSKWCLRELAGIMKSLKCMNGERYVLPVFYKVNPSDVKCENSMTLDHIQYHELELGKNSITVATWKAALIDLAGIAGWHFENGTESKLVKDVVRRVLNLLQRRSVMGSMGNRSSFFSFFEEIGNRFTANLKNALNLYTSHGQSGGVHGVKNRPFTPTEVQKITANFKTVIGACEYGKVFLGILPNGTTIAVDMLYLSQQRAHKNFLVEAQLLMSIHHQNLVPLIDYCGDAKSSRAYLVYEFVANGNLRQHLSNQMKPNMLLSWDNRLRIARDIARGLCCLHNHWEQVIIHGDLKTSNILLTVSMEAKISGFGFSQTSAAEIMDLPSVDTHTVGTVGYMDPEFWRHGFFNKKTDVYSFGIILFELITGRDPMTRITNSSIINILEWVNPLIERRDVQSVVDPGLNGQFSIDSAWKVIEIAMSCC